MTIPSSDQRSTRLFTAIVAAYLVYAGLFIFKTTFVIDGQRYFCLWDEAMISMRYARNLIDGHGLVWNPGQRVQGYTNPLWTVFMAGVQLLGLPRHVVSLPIQIVGAVLLAVNLHFVRRIADSIFPESRGVAIAAVILTAFYLPLNNWTLQGMEVGAITLLLNAAVAWALDEPRSAGRTAAMLAALATAILLRLDAVLPALLVVAFVIRRGPRRAAVAWAGLATLVAAVAAQLLFSYLYYHDPLPNTYYLKMTGYPIHLRMARGLYVLLQFIWYANPALLALPFIPVLCSGRRPVRGLLLGLVAVQAAYSVYIGGDIAEYFGGANRFLAVAMPAFFILLARSLKTVVELVVGGMDAEHPPAARRPRAAAYVGVVAYALIQLNAVLGLDSLGVFCLADELFFVEMARDNVRLTLDVEQVTRPAATVAVYGAGQLPFFADRPAVDLLGKNDPVIARMPGRPMAGSVPWKAFWPGHSKWDYGYSIGKLKPDVVGPLWISPDEARPYLAGEYLGVQIEEFTLFVKKGSPAIRWQRLRQLARVIQEVS